MSTFSYQIFDKLGKLLNNSSDLVVKSVGNDMAVAYMSCVVQCSELNTHILSVLMNQDHRLTLEQVLTVIPIGGSEILPDIDDTAAIKMLQGRVLIAVSGQQGCVMINAADIPTRQPSNAENETLMFGTMQAFIESLDRNVALMRAFITDPALCNEQYAVGKRTRTQACLLYLDDVADHQYVDLVRTRIINMKSDGVIGSAQFLQLIQDSGYYLFPMLSLTERPDRAAQALLEGKIVVIVEGNSQVIIGPNSFVDFFVSTEDRFSSWGLGTFYRMIRLIGLFMSVFLTPGYVAALTFHYEIIPTTLLAPLIISRSLVPFPPLIETLVLELTMELLREAGARLPTKVGQTMGIVGGIVIGQAAVQAGFTSNILIMLVALAALGSYTTPNYMMSGAIRFVRFPIIVFAGLWGVIGIVFMTALIIIHLLKMTSLGRPYMYPIFPFRVKEIWRDMLVTHDSHFLHKSGFTQNEHTHDEQEQGKEHSNQHNNQQHNSQHQQAKTGVKE
ncbi:spore germination protein [Paenibacillus sp. UMB4589-SE434]|uniref:spore germination protein n=1 Tax=Paenibacillus sp. UMB4589-SE434 TaxID=3046314 RepID=UPI002550813B|nr:spore germination protein [Paenibacillus sp. UMB4589-SE434]MDK8180522.1 spore germination protein [Paenibacillus sp. UMB4589-SE434]